MKDRFWTIIAAVGLTFGFLAALFVGAKHGAPEQTRSALLNATFVQAWENADEFHLLSLDPICENSSRPTRPLLGRRDVDLQFVLENSFHGYRVIGSVAVENLSQRSQLLEVLRKGILAPDDSTSVMCFLPRHGLRIDYDGQIHDFLICFQCNALECFTVGPQSVTHHTLRATPASFNELLDDAGINRDVSGD